ncbi:GNAT family N-acetyltransferase [Paenibacillus gansuensis]|uniref:GNAT family N-acetyltransferase n=1 Tax=Paenibacillus gansuensis TaxID=306542 RepID=A0ABW5PDS6_9BACL
MIDIRVLTPADAEPFWNLRLRALKEHPRAFLASYEENEHLQPAEVAHRLDRTDSNVVIGAFTPESGLIGIVGLVREQRQKTRHRATIWGMYVAPDSQSGGIGAQLLARAIEEGRTMEGLSIIELSVILPNPPAQRLYDKMGFAVYGLHPRALRVDGLDYDEELRSLEL